MKDIDIRIIQLARWQVPKDKSVLGYQEEDTYLAVGYFDMVDVSEGAGDMMEQPLLAAYRNSKRHPGNSNPKGVSLLGDYTVQELFLFTDICKYEGEALGFTEREIQEFWEDKDSVMYVSLIHIDNDSDVYAILSNIEKYFSEEKYLYYFSFDYSGIVLLAKKMTMRQYLTQLFRLNYDKVDSKKLIRDSYSFFCFSKSIFQNIFAQTDKGKDLAEVIKEICTDKVYLEQFFASVNIGIQNFNVYQEFINQIKAYSTKAKTYGLFGRHDISLVMEEADFQWLLYVQCLLEQYTNEKAKIGRKDTFATHETFIKLENIGNYEDHSATEKDDKNNREADIYKNIKANLNEKCKQYFKALNTAKERLNGEYGIPVEAVKNSILSILKNQFAEDFVLCIYQTFDEFLSYLLEKMEYGIGDVEEFDTCFSEFFHCLNSLANSAMHSERQFIQATAFNAIIYDVPSKIMAFYAALIDEFQTLMRGEKDKQYTFLLTPSFSNEISVKIISYQKEIPPHDRILMVSINERSLYNPKAVIRRMAHEVAHFVGDDLRNRSLRKKQIKLSIIYIILSQVLHGSFLSIANFLEVIDIIENKISKKEIFSDDKYNYSIDLLKTLPDIADEFLITPEVSKVLHDYIKAVLNSYLQGDAAKDQAYGDERDKLWNYIVKLVGTKMVMPEHVLEQAYEGKKFSEAERSVLLKLICDDVEQELKIVNKDKELLRENGRITQSIISGVGCGVLNENTVGNYVKALCNIYSEAFADIQMILITGISYEAYLEGFINEENIDLSNFEEQMEDSSRISMVTLALHLSGEWENIEIVERELENGYTAKKSEEKGKLVLLQKKIKEQINIVLSSISDNTRKSIAEIKETNNFSDTELDGWLWDEDFCSLLSAEGGDNMMYYINVQLLLYLLECIAESDKCYQKKADDIKELQKSIGTVSEFKKVLPVFTKICAEIERYKKKILLIE